MGQTGEFAAGSLIVRQAASKGPYKQGCHCYLVGRFTMFHHNVGRMWKQVHISQGELVQNEYYDAS